MSAFRIERGDGSRIDELEPLWVSLQEHHAELEEVPPVRPFEESWERRRAQYERWLGDGGAGQLFLAMVGERAVGYLMMRSGAGASTWAIGDGAAEIETLAVLEEARSSGAGHALMEAAFEAAAAQGIRAIGVGVVHSNDDAIRFYERHGFRQFYLQLLKVDD